MAKIKTAIPLSFPYRRPLTSEGWKKAESMQSGPDAGEMRVTDTQPRDAQQASVPTSSTAD